jgi:hypothetical protein
VYYKQIGRGNPGLFATDTSLSVRENRNLFELLGPAAQPEKVMNASNKIGGVDQETTGKVHGDLCFVFLVKGHQGNHKEQYRQKEYHRLPPGPVPGSQERIHALRLQISKPGKGGTIRISRETLWIGSNSSK